MALPAIKEQLGVDSPCFIRKLVRKSHWGAHGDNPDERISNAVRQAFPQDDPAHSFFELRTDEDFHRVVLGLNANRSRITDNLDLIAFQAEEFEICGIKPQSTPGDTRCDHANARHVDVSASAEQFKELCKISMEKGRTAGRLKEADLLPIISVLTAEGCRALAPESKCKCHG